MTAQDRYLARMEKRKTLGRALNVILSNQPELYKPKAVAKGKQKQGGEYGLR